MYLLDSADKFGAEHEEVGVALLNAVLDLLRGVAVVERYGDRARFQDSEVDGQPVKAVHQQNRDLFALFYSAREQQIGKPVRLYVKFAPGYLLFESAVA